MFVTDSFRPALWRVTNAQVRARLGNAPAIPVAPEITYTAGFNLNGIVARGHELIVVQSSTGKLFSIQLEKGGPLVRSTRSRPTRSPAATECCSTAAG